MNTMKPSDDGFAVVYWRNYKFSPKETVVKLGSTVYWVFPSNQSPHIEFADGESCSRCEKLPPNVVLEGVDSKKVILLERTFASTGLFEYSSPIYSFMTGVIEVSAMGPPPKRSSRRKAVPLKHILSGSGTVHVDLRGRHSPSTLSGRSSAFESPWSSPRSNGDENDKGYMAMVEASSGSGSLTSGSFTSNEDLDGEDEVPGMEDYVSEDLEEIGGIDEEVLERDMVKLLSKCNMQTHELEADVHHAWPHWREAMTEDIEEETRHMKMQVERAELLSKWCNEVHNKWNSLTSTMEGAGASSSMTSGSREEPSANVTEDNCDSSSTFSLPDESTMKRLELAEMLTALKSSVQSVKASIGEMNTDLEGIEKSSCLDSDADGAEGQRQGKKKKRKTKQEKKKKKKQLSLSSGDGGSTDASVGALSPAPQDVSKTPVVYALRRATPPPGSPGSPKRVFEQDEDPPLADDVDPAGDEGGRMAAMIAEAFCGDNDVETEENTDREVALNIGESLVDCVIPEDKIMAEEDFATGHASDDVNEEDETQMLIRTLEENLAFLENGTNALNEDSEELEAVLAEETEGLVGAQEGLARMGVMMSHMKNHDFMATLTRSRSTLSSNKDALREMRRDIMNMAAEEGVDLPSSSDNGSTSGTKNEDPPANGEDNVPELIPTTTNSKKSRPARRRQSRKNRLRAEAEQLARNPDISSGKAEVPMQNVEEHVESGSELAVPTEKSAAVSVDKSENAAAELEPTSKRRANRKAKKQKAKEALAAERLQNESSAAHLQAADESKETPPAPELSKPVVLFGDFTVEDLQSVVDAPCDAVVVEKVTGGAVVPSTSEHLVACDGAIVANTEKILVEESAVEDASPPSVEDEETSRALSVHAFFASLVAGTMQVAAPTPI